MVRTHAKARYPNATFDYVGHSNGTYLAAGALQEYAAARFGNIYFAGSVVRVDFHWNKFAAAGRVEHFHNARGATDWVIALAPKSVDYVSELGGGGFDGFTPAALDAPGLTQSEKFAWGQHSGAIGEGHWPGIARFIATGIQPPEPENLFKQTPGPYAPLDYVSRLRLLGVPLVAVAVPSILVGAIEKLFPCGAEHGFAIPEYCFYALLVAAPPFFLFSPKAPPSAAPWDLVAKWAAGLGAALLSAWFVFAVFWLALAQCSSVLSAVMFVALLAMTRFVLTKY